LNEPAIRHTKKKKKKKQPSLKKEDIGNHADGKKDVRGSGKKIPRRHLFSPEKEKAGGKGLIR